MGEELTEELPLPTLWRRAQAAHGRCSSLSQLDPDEVNNGIRLLLQCQQWIDKLGIFSRNEAKEDISTADLKYLLVEFYLGELTEKLPSTERVAVVRAAIAHLKTFITSCEMLELVPEAELQAFTRDHEADPATRRDEKIVRFRRQRAAESKLQEIKERRERCMRSMQAAGIETVVDYGDESLPDEDDEEERQARFEQISLTLCKALDLLDSLKLEEQMLAAIQKEHEKGNANFAQELLNERHARAENWHREAAVGSRNSRPAQPITCSTYAQDVIEGRAHPREGGGHSHHHHMPMFGPVSAAGTSITSERQRLTAEVFQPSHRMPTMSIEQAGLKEMEMMQKWQEMNQKLQEESRSTWVDDDKRSDSEDEAAEYKQRAWDDWKDENPRGSGNKKLTPCG